MSFHSSSTSPPQLSWQPQTHHILLRYFPGSHNSIPNMDSAKQSSDSAPKDESPVKSSVPEDTGTGETAEQATGTQSTIILQATPLSDRTNHRVSRDGARGSDSKAVTVVYPDFHQVPLSNLQATGVFQLANNTDFSTAEIAANSPRYRRRSSTFIDGVHDIHDEKASPMAPAQLYSTMSGRLFHSGRIAIVLVGPPARGKTLVNSPFDSS